VIDHISYPSYKETDGKNIEKGIGTYIWCSLTLRRPTIKSQGKARGVPMTYIRVIKDTYEGAKTRVRTVGGDLGRFHVEVRLHQGSTLSCFYLPW